MSSGFKIRDRFKGAEYMELMANTSITVVGAGGIGSSHLLNLAKAGAQSIYLYEMDTVGEHNLGGQRFSKSQIGKPKADAMMDNMYDQADYDSVYHQDEFFVDDEVTPIVHMCVDNNKVRALAFDSWFKQAESEDWKFIVKMGDEEVDLGWHFFDARISFSSYDTFMVTRETAEIYRDNFLQISERKLVPGCTTNSNVHMGSMAADKMFQNYINELQNRLDVHDGFEATNFTPFNLYEEVKQGVRYVDYYGKNPVAIQRRAQRPAWT